MNRNPLIFTILAIALLCGCGGKDGRPSVNGTYPKEKHVTRIVQYNVGVFAKEIENSIPMVAAMLTEIGADAVSVNELDSCTTRHGNYQLSDFAGAMGGWEYRFSRAMPFAGGAYGVGITVPEKILSSFTVPLPKGKGTEPRACGVVETKRYILATTHLDYKDMPSMVIQAKTINEALAAKYARSKKPVFLAGDLNATAGSDVLKELGKEWDVLSCGKNTFSADTPYERIDFILALRNGAKYSVVGSDVPVEFEGGDVKVASDHLPLFVDVKL